MKHFSLALVGWAAVTLFYGVALRAEWLPRKPAVLAAMAGVLLIGCLVQLLRATAGMVKKRRVSMRALGVLLGAGGICLTGGAGLANWLFSLQAAIILAETEAVPLSMTSHFQGFEAGLLADRSELDWTMQVERFELAPTSADSFTPTTQLRLIKGGAEPVILKISPALMGAVDTLRFHQGAFGFSPRIVIARGGDTLFDQVVPFESHRPGPGALRFEGSFEVEKEKLAVRGAVDLSNYDEQMKGHARLILAVERDHQPLGQGELRPGHFAELQDGYRVGFVGLKKWTEIVISRRTYSEALLAGLVPIALGCVLWGIGLLLERRRA